MNKRFLSFFILIVFFLLSGLAHAQPGFDDDRVMLQGFYWESYRHGMPERFPEFGPKRWYEIFLKNHDTGYRTNEDGTPQAHHETEDFHNDWQVEQGYAYILTHPGVPTVFWKHYFDWGNQLQNKITALINARKVAGVHAGSVVHTQHNARQKGVYAARVKGKNSDLHVRIGGSDQKWRPIDSNYAHYREYAHGSGCKVWVRIDGNPPVRQAPPQKPLPVPAYRHPDEIDVPDTWLETNLGGDFYRFSIFSLDDPFSFVIG